MTNQTKEVKQPARLDIIDLPRDKDRVLGSLRQGLCASFNYCRRYKGKLEVLKATLELVLGRINQQLEANKLEAEEAVKAAEANKIEPIQTPIVNAKTAPVAPKAAQTPLTNKEAK